MLSVTLIMIMTIANQDFERREPIDTKGKTYDQAIHECFLLAEQRHREIVANQPGTIEVGTGCTAFKGPK
jgi:hypothetical protein